MGDHTQEFAVNPAAVREGVSLWLDPVIHRLGETNNSFATAKEKVEQGQSGAPGWVGGEGQLFENDLIRFQISVENGYLRVAERLVKYRAIFQQAGQDMAKLMDALTQRFAGYGQGKGIDIDLRSFLLTGLVEVVCAVITGGASSAFRVMTIAEVATQMAGDAGKTAKEKGRNRTTPSTTIR